MGPLTRTSKGNQVLLIICDKFKKLMQAIALRPIDALTIPVAFMENWVLRYGVPKAVLSDNGSKFASKFFQVGRKILGIDIYFTSY